jgi:hypothetical protein
LGIGVYQIHSSEKIFAAVAENEGDYLRKLGEEGKHNWQVKQTADSLRVCYQAMELVRWARLAGTIEEFGG